MFLPLIFVFLVYVESIAAETNVFQTPPSPGPTKDYSENPTYNIGATVQLAWSMNFTGAKLTITQDNKPGDMVGGSSAVILQNTNLQGLHWTVSYMGLDPTINNAFYFTVGTDEYSFTSHYFYIYGVEAQTASVSTSTSTSTTTLSSSSSSSSSLIASTSSTTATSSPSSSTSTPPPSAQSAAAPGSTSTSMSAGAIAGIAVGTTLGTVAVVVASVGFFIRRWLKKRDIRMPPAPSQSDGGTGASYPAYSAVGSTHQSQELGGVPMAEVDGDHRITEHQPQYWRHEMLS